MEFVDIMYGFFYNTIFMIFAVIAGLRADENKRPWGFFTTGVIIQSLADSDMLLKILQHGSYISPSDISALSFTAISFICGYLIVRKTYKQAQKEAAAKSRRKGDNQ